MSLPKINNENVVINYKLPSKKQVGISPWKVKDEQELLFIKESLDKNSETYFLDFKNEIFKFLKKCIDDPIQYNSYSTTDIIRIAMLARILSKGNDIEFNYQCPHCNLKFEAAVDLNKDCKIKEFDDNPIIIDNIIFNISEISYLNTEKLLKRFKDSFSKFSFYTLIYMIDSIVVDGEIYSEFTEDEMVEFINNLKPIQYEKLSNELVPKIAECYIDKKVKCFKCKEMIEINFGDVLDFLVF